jgi:molecular chaperone DnaJ
MAQSKDFYAVLGVSSTASSDDIKKQYRRLAKKYHPDANANDPKASERFKEISEAYQVLGDADRRKQYDDMRRMGAFGGFGPGGPRARGTAPPPGAGTGARYQEFDVGGLGGLGDLFSSMFGADVREPGPGPRNRASRSRAHSKCRFVWRQQVGRRRLSWR